MIKLLSKNVAVKKALLTFLLLFTGGIPATAENSSDMITLAPGQIPVTASTFTCIRDMTKVRGFYVDNLKGDLEATLAVANSATGGVYPPGSVVQLIPGEVMVKHEVGYNPVTKDWEFFELDVSEEGSEIRKRGFADVVNRFGGNCFACHLQAKPQWDMVCEDTHGCDPIPITKQVVDLIQRTDPRCSDNEALSAGESFELFKLKLKVSVGTAIGSIKEMM